MFRCRTSPVPASFVLSCFRDPPPGIQRNAVHHGAERGLRLQPKHLTIDNTRRMFAGNKLLPVCNTKKEELGCHMTIRFTTSVGALKFSSRPTRRRVAFKYDRTWAKWMSSRALIALSSTRISLRTTKSSR